MQQPQIIAWSMELLGSIVVLLLLGACGRKAPAARDLIGREICKRCVINSCVANYKGKRGRGGVRGLWWVGGLMKHIACHAAHTHTQTLPHVALCPVRPVCCSLTFEFILRLTFIDCRISFPAPKRKIDLICIKCNNNSNSKNKYNYSLSEQRQGALIKNNILKM